MISRSSYGIIEISTNGPPALLHGGVTMAMTKTQQALEALFLKLQDHDDVIDLNNIYIHFPDHFISLLSCLEIVSNRLAWTYCSQYDENGYIVDLEYKRDEILNILVSDDFTIQSH